MMPLHFADRSFALDTRRIPVKSLVTQSPVYVRDAMWADGVWALLVAKGLSSAPVLDADGHPVGTIFRQDLAAFFSERFEDDEPVNSRPPLRRQVKAIMRPEVLTVREEESLAHAALLAQRSQAAHVILVDHNGAMIAAIARADVLRAGRSSSY